MSAKRIALAVCIAAVLPVTFQASARADGPKGAAFFLKPDDTVVFMGDSITALNHNTYPYQSPVPNYTYCTDIMSWVATQLPGNHIKFYDLAVGGDTALGDFWPKGGPSSQGVAPYQTIDERLQTVEGVVPTVVTIDLGMNDGEYVDCNPADPGYNATLYNSFTSGMTHIVSSLIGWSTAGNHPLRIVLVSPSYFDNNERVQKGWSFPWGGPPVANYNETLLAFGSWEKQYAATLRGSGVSFIDTNGPMAAANAALPHGESVTQEAVHPTELGYEVMAAAILAAWHGDAVRSAHLRSGAAKALPWALHNGGSAYEVSPLLGQVSIEKTTPANVPWQNQVIDAVRNENVGTQTAIMSKSPIPTWDPQPIVDAVNAPHSD